MSQKVLAPRPLSVVPSGPDPAPASPTSARKLPALMLRPAPPLRPSPSSTSSPATATTTTTINTSTGSTSTPTTSTSTTSHSPIFAGSGPLVGAFVVPPRPKPGRKAATEVPPTKRKQQNREAQRSFRARRQQQREQLEQEAAASRREKDECRQLLELATHSASRHEKTISTLQQRCTAAEASVVRLNAEVVAMKAQLEQASHSLRAKDEVVERLTQQLYVHTRARGRSFGSDDVQMLHSRHQHHHHHLPYSPGFDGSVPVHVHPSAMTGPTTRTITTASSSPLSSSASGHGSASLSPLDAACPTCSESPCICVANFAASLDPSSASSPPSSAIDASFSHTMSIGALLAPRSRDPTLGSTMSTAPSVSAATSTTIKTKTTTAGVISGPISYEDREIDFTNFIKPFQGPIVVDESPSNIGMGMGIGIGMAESCGFCTDTTNCICRAKAAEALPVSHGNGIVNSNITSGNMMNPLLSPRVRVSTAAGSVITAPTTAPTSGQKRRPGTCLQCQTNPEQKRFCEELSRRRSPPTDPRPEPTAGMEDIVAEEAKPVNGLVDGDVDVDVDDTARSRPAMVRRPKRARFVTSPSPPPSSLPSSTASSSSSTAAVTTQNADRISCADAYRLSKQPKLRQAVEELNFDQMYEIYKDMKPHATRAAEREGCAGSGRFTAFEIDVGEALTVMASMNRSVGGGQ